ncbi:MAG: hypothetical protein KF716_03525 [Anaerolineae bacterium]|nr:hypothetical protein [Anaerolineae bacterium]
MPTNPHIFSIGFDGPNRVGKGMQCDLLQARLTSHGIPSLVVRGDGSRTGLGETTGDPVSAWWQDINRWLRTPAADTETWNRTSYRLARELIVWRDRALPCLVRQRGKSVGVLIVDRSLPSRTMVLRAAGVTDVANNLYTLQMPSRGRKIDPFLVCPDMIFLLTAPLHVLLDRLDPADPKYAFRKELILRTRRWFEDAEKYIPAVLRDRIVHLDGSHDATMIFSEVLVMLRARLGIDLAEEGSVGT